MDDPKGEYIQGHKRLSPMGRYLVACQAGPPCGIELYVDQWPDKAVGRYSVRKIDARTYRAVVLWSDHAPKPNTVEGHDGSREEVQRWLTSIGVPILRISPPKATRK